MVPRQPAYVSCTGDVELGTSVFDTPPQDCSTVSREGRALRVRGYRASATEVTTRRLRFKLNTTLPRAELPLSALQHLHEKEELLQNGQRGQVSYVKASATIRKSIKDLTAMKNELESLHNHEMDKAVKKARKKVH